MRGDIILVGEEHRRAATIIIDHLIDEIRATPRRFTITVAGESGSGKSEMGQALADRSSVVIEDDTADETRESQLELDFEESEIDEPTGLGDNPDNGA